MAASSKTVAENANYQTDDFPDGEGATIQSLSCSITEVAVICQLILCKGMLPRKQYSLSRFSGACTFRFGDNS